MGRIILCIDWNDLRLWNRLVTLHNAFLLAVLLLAKFLLLLQTSTFINPNVSKRWRAVYQLTIRVKLFFVIPIAAGIKKFITNSIDHRVIIPCENCGLI